MTDYEEEPYRRSYPWEVWEAEPYRQHTIRRYDDFDVDPRKMTQVIRTRAQRKGVNVNVTGIDDEGLGRVSFCFYKKDSPRPRLRPHSLSMMSLDLIKSDAPEIPIVRCVICGEDQARLMPTLQHVRECLIKNPNDPRDSAFYAKHRHSSDSPTAMRKVPMVGVAWTQEDGPIA